MRMSFFHGVKQGDEELLASLNRGDEHAFTVIYERYHKLLYVLYKYLKSSCAAEDAVQQVFLKLWESRQLLLVNVNLRNYLYTMMKNHVLNEIRNNYSAIEKNYEMIQVSPGYEDELLAKLEEKELMERFYQAIGRLPEQKRQVCLYKLRGNLSNQEIAERMNLSIPTVKSHYAQAIKMLRGYFETFFSFLLYVWNSSF